jgi:tripartite-type tricarboxylate transporter receptor subunit TctC
MSFNPARADHKIINATLLQCGYTVVGALRVVRGHAHKHARRVTLIARGDAGGGTDPT